MKPIMLLSVCFCATSLSSCVPLDNRLVLINRTRHKISVEAYKDTIPTLPSPGKREYYLETAFLPGDSIRKRQSGKQGWPTFVAHSQNKKLNLIVYDYSDLAEYSSIDTLIKHKAYKRLVIDRDSLAKTNWKVAVH